MSRRRQDVIDRLPEIREMVAQGIPKAQIAQEMGCSATLITSYLDHPERCSRPQFRESTIPFIGLKAWMRETATTIGQIAEAAGYSRQTTRAQLHGENKLAEPIIKACEDMAGQPREVLFRREGV